MWKVGCANSPHPKLWSSISKCILIKFKPFISQSCSARNKIDDQKNFVSTFYFLSPILFYFILFCPIEIFQTIPFRLSTWSWQLFFLISMCRAEYTDFTHLHPTASVSYFAPKRVTISPPRFDYIISIFSEGSYSIHTTLFRPTREI